LKGAWPRGLRRQDQIYCGEFVCQSPTVNSE